MGHDTAKGISVMQDKTFWLGLFCLLIRAAPTINLS